MCEVLYFYRGAITLTDYEGLSAARLRTVKRWMRDVQEARARANKRGGS
jgi:hypothetical protein